MNGIRCMRLLQQQLAPHTSRRGDEIPLLAPGVRSEGAAQRRRHEAQWLTGGRDGYTICTGNGTAGLCSGVVLEKTETAIFALTEPLGFSGLREDIHCLDDPKSQYKNVKYWITAESRM
uniref:Uncharacterized protein n=1 Tax=Oryza sativa subsp. japonica TaxID=39947 RepID=Q6EP84_ORYSJ|nr:hypothetical protein [Oryza sativa Japonica Group]